MHIVTMHFIPDPFLRTVNERLRTRGLLHSTITGGEVRRWHKQAWLERFGPETPSGTERGVREMDTAVILPALGTIDRVFVSSQPVREVLRYLSNLDLIATDRLREFPSGSIIVYARIPHYPWEVVLARRAELMGHRVLTINNIYVNNRVTLEEGTNFFRPAVLDANRPAEQLSITRAELQSKHLEGVKELNLGATRASLVIWWLRMCAWLVFPGSTVKWLRAVALDRKNQSIFSRSQLLLALHRLLKQRRAIKRLLRQIGVRSLAERQFVLVALHYQPEATTEPAGGRFADQVLFVQEVREALDNAGLVGVEILVREHPRHVVRTIPALGEVSFRSTHFYRELASIHGVNIASPALHMNDLISRSILVATVNGTAAWEAIQAGRPAITGRRTWYGDCAAVKTVEEIARCPETLQEILVLDPSDIHRALNQFLDTERVTFAGTNSAADLSVPQEKWGDFADSMIDGILRRIYVDGRCLG